MRRRCAASGRRPDVKLTQPIQRASSKLAQAAEALADGAAWMSQKRTAGASSTHRYSPCQHGSGHGGGHPVLQ